MEVDAWFSLVILSSCDTQNMMPLIPHGARKHILCTDVTFTKQCLWHYTSKMDDTFLNLVLLFAFYFPIGFVASACMTCLTFSSLYVITKLQCCSINLLLRCENYLMVGMLLLNLDSMASKIPLCLAKNRAEPCCVNKTRFMIWLIISHYCGICGNGGLLQLATNKQMFHLSCKMEMEWKM